MATSIAPRPVLPTSEGSRPTRGLTVAARPVVSVSTSPAGSIPQAWIEVPLRIGEGILLVTSESDITAEVSFPAQEALMKLEADALVEAMGGYLESTGEAVMPLEAESAGTPVLTYAGDSELILESSAVTSSEMKLLPMGMNKSGNQDSGFVNAAGKIVPLANWVARPGMAANIVDNGLVMNASKTGVIVNWGFANNNGNDTYGWGVLYKNSTAISIGKLYGTGSLTVDVNAGDVLSMQFGCRETFGVTALADSIYIYTS